MDFDRMKVVTAIKEVIKAIGDDPQREGLAETPLRVIKAWDELFAGYRTHPKDVLTLFDNPGYDEMVVVRNVEFVSFCEHHMLQFEGLAHVGYLPRPRQKVVGLSKLARVVDAFAKRLQIQERMTDQICEAVYDNVPCDGAACVVEATHTCMSCRGVRKHGATMITSSLRGAFKTDAATRAEFMNLIGSPQ
jgi:GTP cyclohydrolase I